MSVTSLAVIHNTETGELAEGNLLPVLFMAHTDNLSQLATWTKGIRVRMAMRDEDTRKAIVAELGAGGVRGKVYRTVMRFAQMWAIDAWLKDIAAEGVENGWSDKVVQGEKDKVWALAADMYRITVHRVMNYVDTAQVYSEDEIVFPLSFEHYEAVRTAPGDMRKDLLDRAVKGGWTRDHLRVEYRKERQRAALGPEIVGGEEKDEQEVNGHQVDVTQREDNENEEDFEAKADYRDGGAEDSLQAVLDDLEDIAAEQIRAYMIMVNNAASWADKTRAILYRDMGTSRSMRFKADVSGLRNRLLKLAEENGYYDDRDTESEDVTDLDGGEIYAPVDGAAMAEADTGW